MSLIEKAIEKKFQFKKQNNKMDNTKIIEKARQSLNFVEQLQNQIQLCREALSDTKIPLTPKVETLESLLWAKIKNDKEYNEIIEELNRDCSEKIKQTKNERNKKIYQRLKAKEQFKAIMIFIDRKGYMPLGEENE